jgi:RNA polymerase sigma-70 factor (ECF subfamily)
MVSSPKPWASDRELVDQILSGSQADFNQLYDAYFNRVYRFALKRLRDQAEAEDVAQEVFMTLLTALASYQGQSSLLVWIFGITRNKVNRRFRRPRMVLEPLEDGGALDVEGKQVGAEQSFEARRVLDRCQDVIDQEFTDTQREIFHLKHRCQEPIRTIAEKLGKSEDAIKANLYRMRRVISQGTPGLKAVLDY